MPTTGRVGTYLTLLNTVTLLEAQCRDTRHVEEQLRAAWKSLSSPDRADVLAHLAVSKAQKRAAPRLRLIKGDSP